VLEVSFTPLREQIRYRCRGLLMCMSFCGGLAVAAFAPQSGYHDPTSVLFVGVVFGVPGGLILYPVYRFVKFALGH
jgi:hypothetical protein